MPLYSSRSDIRAVESRTIRGAKYASQIKALLVSCHTLKHVWDENIKMGHTEIGCVDATTGAYLFLYILLQEL